MGVAHLSYAGVSAAARRLIQRSPLPSGTLAVGGGLAVAGVSAYAFLAIAARALGTHRYAPLSTLWALIFVTGPGLFLPLEQEVGRALSARRVRGEGGAPLIRRAALAGGGVALLISVLALTLGRPLLDRLFDGDALLSLAFVLALGGYFAEFLVRGMLSGNGRFVPYGMIIGGEAALRAVGVVLFALLGLRVAGLYGLMIAVGSVAAVAVVLRGQRGLFEPGPAAPWSELTGKLGYLLTGSILAAFLVNAGPLTVKLISTPAQHDAAGIFLSGLIMARTPLFFFQAIQAALLPRLAALASAGRHAEFRHGFGRLLLLVAAVGGLAVLGFALLGPLIVRVLFGRGFVLSHGDMAALAAASAIYMLALALAQALIALEQHGRSALGWLVGVVTFFGAVVALQGMQLLTRVETALIASSVSATLAMAVLLLPELSRPEGEAERANAATVLGAATEG
ncbi:MAG: hypothetical protein NVSMB29_01740 [Candidatus Dormibacteria bacterium]